MSLPLTNVPRLPGPEHIRGAAPDHATRRAADELARGDNRGQAGWSDLGETAGRLLWAEYAEGKRAPVHTTALLPSIRVACSCPATRFPCRHILALLLRDQSGGLAYQPSPEWASQAEITRPARSDAVAADQRDPRREELIAGMADLNRWLGDLARQGLAGLPQRRRQEWLAAADRLADAYAPEAARELRELSLMPGSAPDWPERLLPRLGRLALLCAAFQRLGELSPGEQADALTAAGRPPRPGDDCVADTGLVAGVRQEPRV